MFGLQIESANPQKIDVASESVVFYRVPWACAVEKHSQLRLNLPKGPLKRMIKL